MLDLKPLNDQNFLHFITLLKERGEAPEDYYRWKYLDQPALGQPTGFIAYLDDKPVGCIGIINRMYHAADGNECRATWFADWFVSDSCRGYGVGEMLLKGVSKCSEFSFGIPGPVKAQALAKKIGYLPNPYFDYVYLLRPLNFVRKKFKKDSLIKSLVRSFLFLIKYSFAPHKNVGYKYSELDQKEFKVQLMQNRNSDSNTFLIREDFVEWFINMPPLPNGKKTFWVYRKIEVGCVVFGFTEVDNYGLVRATIIFANNLDSNVGILKSLFTELRVEKVDYILIALPVFHSSKVGIRFLTIKEVPFSSLKAKPILSYPIDRESIWYSQQIFN